MFRHFQLSKDICACLLFIIAAYCSAKDGPNSYWVLTGGLILGAIMDLFFTLMGEFQSPASVKDFLGFLFLSVMAIILLVFQKEGVMFEWVTVFFILATWIDLISIVTSATHRSLYLLFPRHIRTRVDEEGGIK